MQILTTIQKNGRILLPARLRKLLGVDAGDVVILRLEGNLLQVIPLQEAVRLAQARVKAYVPEGTSLVETLLSERRREAGHE